MPITYDEIYDESLKPTDANDPMLGLGHWSPRTAERMARDEGIEELTEEHWQVLFALRNFYRQHGPADSAREVIHQLEREFADDGGRRYLYQLFPKGPISQGSRLAGLPVPPHSSDPSFGWAG